MECDKMDLMKKRIHRGLLGKSSEYVGEREYCRGCTCLSCLKIMVDVWKEHITRFVHPSLLQLM